MTRFAFAFVLSVVALASWSCDRSAECDTLLIANAPFVPCDEIPAPPAHPACYVPPVSRLRSDPSTDAGPVGTCSVTMLPGGRCEIRDPSPADGFLPFVYVLATESGPGEYVLDSAGSWLVCAVPCGNAEFPCVPPATCVTATASSGVTVSICQFPQ